NVFTAFKAADLPTGGTVLAHQIAWHFDSASGETIIYANPNSTAALAGDSSLLEIHLIGNYSSFINAGYFTVSGGALTNAPAGTAGEPINLGLTAPSSDTNALVTITIDDLPAGWTLNGGIHNADGSWSVQTSDVSTLTR